MTNIQLFDQLGKLYEKELKFAKGKKAEKADSSIQKHLLVDDFKIGSIDKELRVKIGGFLTNLMVKNLKFFVGSKEMFLLKANKRRSKTDFKTTGIIEFDKAFIEKFV